MIAETRTCLSCGKTIRGRTDKKFCNDNCRNTYNNALNGNSNKYIRSINYLLRRNRRLLEKILPVSKHTIKTTRQKLFNKGFRFRYFTHTQLNAKGKLYYFCYEYGYFLLEKEQVLIVRRKENTEEEL